MLGTDPTPMTTRMLFFSFRTSLLFFWVIAGLLVASCAPPADEVDAEAQAEADAEARAVPVVVAEATLSTFTDLVQLTGTVEANEDAILSAESSGTLRSLLPLGRSVSRGQVIAQIDAGLAASGVQQAEAGVAVARAQLDLAEDQFARQEPLYADSIISPLEFQSVRAQLASARAQYAQAEAALAQAREQHSRTRIVAPFSGVIEAHHAEIGEQVNPGMPVVRIVGTQSMKITAGVPERYAADIRMGTLVTITPQAYGIESTTGTVSFVGRAIDTQSRTFPIEIRPDERDERFKPQMLVRLDISRRTLDDVVIVPLSSIVRDEGGTMTYVIRQEGNRMIARAQPVVLGATGRDEVVILQGIEPGDRVVILGQTTISDGELVRIMTPSTSATSNN